MKQLIIMTVVCLSLSIQGQTIVKSSIDSGGASASAGNIRILYTIGEVVVQEVSVGTIILSEGFIGKPLKITIDPKAFLQGPFINPDIVGLMNDDLRNGAYIPTASPYSDAVVAAASVFNTGGTSGSGLTQDDIVDWVWVELRDQNNNTTILASKSALLQRDGDIIEVDGVSNMHFDVGQSNYYVVVNHRNHLGAMTSVALNLLDDSTSVIDFRTNGLATIGTNARVDMGSGNLALWAGDVGGNEQVRYLGPGNDTNSIKDAVLADVGNNTNSNFYPYLGYDNADVNMNGQIRYLGPGNDTNILKDIILSHPSNGTSSNFFPFIMQISN